MSVPYAAAQSDRPTYPDVKATHGEDPARYLAVDENDPYDEHPLALAHARIKDIDDLELLKAWQRIEAENWGRTQIMAHLNKRERELRDEPIATDAELQPVPATDGGETITDDTATHDEITAHHDEHDEPHPIFEVPHKPVRVPTKPEDTSSQATHPDATALEAGRVLVVELEETTEYVWPAKPDADLPYLLVIHDKGDDGDDPTGLELSKSDLFERVRNDDPEERPAGEIPIDSPDGAATNGGDS